MATFTDLGCSMLTPRVSLTLTLLQAREAAMAFFRPLLNRHGLTEQQWRVIRLLKQRGDTEMHELANQACILKPSMSGVLARMEQTGYVARYRNPRDARRVHVKLTAQGEACFEAMAGGMEANYQRILKQFGEEKLGTLIGLLEELKRIEPEGGVAPACGSEQDA